MTNWLESEEKQKKQDEIDKSIREQNELRLDNSLNAFFSLCNRFNNIGNQGLQIDYLNVEVGNPVESTDYDYITTEYGTTHRLELTVFSYRGITFSLFDSENVLMTLYNRGHRSRGSDFNEVIFSKSCQIKDINDWQKEKMVNIIGWIISKFNSFEKYLPGENECLIREKYKGWLETEKDKLSKVCTKLEHEKMVLNNVKSFHFGRGVNDKEFQIQVQDKIIGSLKSDIDLINKTIDFINQSYEEEI